jgi:RsiW-degrading membrane proteinase PrsW (M82 family)
MTEEPPNAVPPTTPAELQTQQALPASGLAIASLVLGIISVLFSCFWPLAIVCGVLAVVFGFIGINKSKKGEAGGKSMALAGVITGGIGILLSVLLVAGLVAVTTLGVKVNNVFSSVNSNTTR